MPSAVSSFFIQAAFSNDKTWRASPRLRKIKHTVAKDNKTNEDDDLFRQMMSDVKPLPAKQAAERIPPAKPRQTRRQADAPATNTINDFVPRDQVPEVAAEEALFFARPGLQHRLLRQFKRGELRPAARLDLHGCTINEAASLLAGFLHDAQAQQQRCVCVIHGKGHRSAEGRPALKAQVNQWLQDAPLVLAFCSASAKDGGMGAMYVLLRRQQ